MDKCGLQNLYHFGIPYIWYFVMTVLRHFYHDWIDMVFTGTPISASISILHLNQLNRSDTPNARKTQEFVMFISLLFLRYPREAFCLLIYEDNISMAWRLEIKSLLVGVSKLLILVCRLILMSFFFSMFIESKQKKGRGKISRRVKMV